MKELDLIAYKIKKFVDNQEDKKQCAVTFSTYYKYVSEYTSRPRTEFSFLLDMEDINYLLNKYQISELTAKEIEQDIAVKHLSKIQEELNFLKSHNEKN